MFSAYSVNQHKPTRFEKKPHLHLCKIGLKNVKWFLTIHRRRQGQGIEKTSYSPMQNRVKE
jgi:hypothetical protein